jgi:sugar phosphate isomerase/epimerase
MQTRRDFLQNSAKLAAGAALLPNLAFGNEEKPIGLQLWSVRDALKDDFEGTIKAVAKAGFNYVEVFGYENGGWFGKNAKAFRSILKDWELKAPTGHCVFKSTHYDAKNKTVTDEWKKVVEDAQKLGQRYLISPWTEDKERINPDTYKAFVEMLNRCGEYCKTQNMRFGYHNHWFEFEKIGDELMYETLLKGTDSQTVTMEMDVCWVTYAKQNPLDWFKKYPGRFELLHMKDMMPDMAREECTAIVGKGAVDFEGIIANSRKAGVKMFICELENYEKSSVDDVKVCYKNLRKLLKA